MNVHSQRRQGPKTIRLKEPASVRYRPREVRTSDQAFASVFGPAVHSGNLSPDQQQAYDSILAWYRDSGRKPVLKMGGYAGTGKSTLIALTAEELTRGSDSRGIAFCAFTGQAASVLRRKLFDLGIRASRDETSRNYVGTIHSLIYEPEIGGKGEVLAWRKRPVDEVEGRYCLIIVDEASMVADELAEDLKSFGVPIFAVGDHGQLTPVDGYGSLMEDPDLRLEQVHRHALDSPILRLSLQIREGGDLPKDLADSEQVRSLHGQDEVAEVLEGLYRQSGAFDAEGDFLEPLEIVALTYTNRMRRAVNGFARDLRHGKDMRESPPVALDQVVCLKNQAGVYNGMRGELESDAKAHDIWYRADSYFPDDGLTVQGSFLRAQLGRDRTFSDLDQINNEIAPYAIKEWRDAGLLFDYGYALTVHKYQGSEARHVFLFYERPYGISADDFKRWAYTAVTRATDRLYIVSG